MSAANLPRIGCHSNLSFTTIQANISAAEPFTPIPENIQLDGNAAPPPPPPPRRRNTRSQPLAGDDDSIDAVPKNHTCKFVVFSIILVLQFFGSSSSRANWHLCVNAS